MPQFLILLYDDERAWQDASEETFAQMTADHNAFGEKNGSAVLGGNALEQSGTATSIRSDGSGGFTVTDGPFVETKEVLGGYYLVEAPDLDAAIEMAKQVPVLRGGVEVRPIMVFN